MVETYTSKIVAWSAERGLHDYAVCGGGPNACMLGSDGALYITQNGGTVGAWRAEVMGRPSIQKAWPDGRVEEVVAEVDGIAAAGAQRPDVRAGWPPVLHRPGRLPAERPQAGPALRPRAGRQRASCSRTIPDAYPNGIAAEADGSIVWVESYERGVYRKRPGAPSEQIAVLPEGHIPDGLKIAADGDLWITTVLGGAVDILGADGTFKDFLETGGAPLNCVFHEGSLIITDFGDITEVTARPRWTAGCGGSTSASRACRSSAARSPARPSSAGRHASGTSAAAPRRPAPTPRSIRP